MRKFWFFDLDGTLADTDRDIREAWKAALRDLGLDCPRFDEVFVAGPPIDEMTRRLFPDRFTPALADDVRRLFASHYDGDGFPNTYEYPGVLDEVRAVAAAGATAAIVTNKRHAGATAMARRFGWEEVFAGGVWAGDMFPGRRLPKTELLAEVMKRIGATPHDSVMVGDTESDFDAARANGVFSVGVEWGYGRPDELAEADVTVSLPCELRAAVQ